MSGEIVCKKSIRQQMKTLRKKMSEQERKEKDALIRLRLKELEEFQNARFFFPFVSYGTETDTISLILELLKTKKKQVAVPRVDGQEMEFYFISSMEELKKNNMGILEPAAGEKAVIEEGVMLMPGLAFDLAKNRVGYGGGYYDRYLAGYDRGQFIKIAVAYDFQVLDRIEADEYDKKPDMIVTDRRIIT